jgi:hypothetical protein
LRHFISSLFIFLLLDCLPPYCLVPSRRRVVAQAGACVDNTSGGAWYAGTTTGYYAMERKTAAGGDAVSNWAGNNGVIRNGTNSGGGPINGNPPRQERRHALKAVNRKP